MLGLVSVPFYAPLSRAEFCASSTPLFCAAGSPIEVGPILAETSQDLDR